MFKNLVCSGGGIKGIAFLGAIRVLQEHGLLEQFTGFAGSSSGAITAGLLAVRCPIGRLEKILGDTDFNLFKDDSFGVLRDTYRVFEEYGFYKGDYFQQWYADLLKEQTGTVDITFRGVYEKYGTDLKITASNLSRQCLEVYDHRKTPDMKVSDAVRRSMSIPLFFKCVRNKEQQVLVDGGLLNNYPINLFDLRETLGLKLIPAAEMPGLPEQEPESIDDIYSYTKGLIGVMLEQIDRLHIRKDYWKVTVPIDTGTVKTTDFNLSAEQKSFLISSGYDATSKFLAQLNQSS